MTEVRFGATGLLLPAPRLAEHQRIWGVLPSIGSAALIQAVADSGLTGRGGAAFPTARKLAAVAGRTGPLVVANGAEGEPASRKDRTLLSVVPHLVLDGLQLAARAVGAATAVLYAPSDLLRDPVRTALAERSDPVPVTLVAAPDAFLAGEASAVVSAVEGRPAVPRGQPPRVFERGVRGRPTLVQNVESLAAIALVAHRGAAYVRRIGTPDEPGPRVVTVSGAVRRPGVFEVPGGSRLHDVVAMAGGYAGPVETLLVGGYHGGWIPAAAVEAGLRLSHADLAPYDAAPGAGVVVAQPPGVCALSSAAEIVGYLSAQGAQQCGPCRNGLPTLAATMHELAHGRPSSRLVGEVQRIAALVENRGACHHPAGTVRLVRSTLRVHAREVDRHLAGRCSTGRRAA